MRIRSFLCAVLVALILLPASLSSAEITDEDMALGGIRIGMTRAEVEELYSSGMAIADGVEEQDGIITASNQVRDYGHTLTVSYRQAADDDARVTSVMLGVNDVNEYNMRPTEEAQHFETPRGIHLDSTREDLEAAYGYIPKPKCSHNAPPVCGYFYDGDTAQIAFYICAEHSPGIRSIWLHEK